jgi:putative peptide zinc metalloprotease protein
LGIQNLAYAVFPVRDSAFFAVPWQRGVSAPAVMEAAQSQALYVPEDARVGQVNVHDGDWVAQGQVLAVLTSDSLDYQIAQAKIIAANLAWQVAQQPFLRGLMNKARH